MAFGLRENSQDSQYRSATVPDSHRTSPYVITVYNYFFGLYDHFAMMSIVNPGVLKFKIILILW